LSVSVAGVGDVSLMVSRDCVNSGAVVPMTTCMAPSYLVSVAPIKPPTETTPTPVATFPTSTSRPNSNVPSSVPSVAISILLTSSVPAVPAPSAAVAAPILVVKQPQPRKPYSAQTSWKQYKEYFTRLANCNGWTTEVEKAQNLLSWKVQ